MNDSNIFNLAQYSLKLIEQRSSNITCAEVFFGISEYINIDIEENSIKNSEIGEDNGVSIRVINRNGSLGFAYANNLEKKTIEKICKIAIKMMNVGTNNPDFKNLPESFKDYPVVKDLYDKKLKDLQFEDSLSYVNDLIRVCDDDEQAISQSGNFSSSYSKTYIFNSNGLEVCGIDTNCLVSSNIIVKDKTTKETSSGYEWQGERMLNKLNALKVAEIALNDAKRNLHRIKISKMEVPVILTPKGTINLILRPIALAINGETFQHKRCFLIGKRDEIIGSEYLNIEDNALINGAYGSSSFDGEGVPCKNKKIIEKGKFMNDGLLHNSYTANKEGVESTGNALRQSYYSLPSIGITNLIMKTGDIELSEMIQNIKSGILLNYTPDSPNLSTGDFSGLILYGNLIKNGEIKEGLNETMIGINLLELYKKIEAVSKDFKTYGSYQAPYVKIKSIKIIGGAN